MPTHLVASYNNRDLFILSPFLSWKVKTWLAEFPLGTPGRIQSFPQPASGCCQRGMPGLIATSLWPIFMSPPSLHVCLQTPAPSLSSMHVIAFLVYLGNPGEVVPPRVLNLIPCCATQVFVKSLLTVTVTGSRN